MKIRTIRSITLGLLLAGVTPAISAPQVAVGKALKEAAPVHGLGDLRKLNDQLVSMAGNCGAATVSLISRGGGGTGSGVIVSEDGLVLTAAHVLAAMTDDVIVIFPDGSRKNAKPLGADFDRDAAMVRITEKGTYPHVELGDSDALERNQWCVAMGHPGGFDALRPPPVRLGRLLLSQNFLITDCTVVGGDSGGPLFDTASRLIGIHSNIGTSLSQNRHVPISIFKSQWEDLEKGKRSGTKFASKPNANPGAPKPFLGVRMGNPSEKGGVKVAEVVKDSPAAKAGILAGDAITEVNGKLVNEAGRLVELLSRFKVGNTVNISVRRDQETEKYEVKLAAMPPAEGEAGKDELDRYLDKMMDGGKGRMELKLTQDDLKKFGGMEKLQERIKERLAKKAAESGDKQPEKPDDAKDDSADTQPLPKNDALEAYLDDMLKDHSKKIQLRLTKEEVEKFGGMDFIQKRVKERLAERKNKAEATPAKPKEAEEPKESKEEGDSDESAQLMKKLLEGALKNGGPIKLTPDMLKKVGGADEVAKRLQEMIKELGPDKLARLKGANPGSDLPDDFFKATIDALTPLAQQAGASTVAILADDKQVALGTVVSDDGWILTKDTETAKGTLKVQQLGHDTRDCKLIKHFPEWDLAILQVQNRDGLKAVSWAKDASTLPLASLLTAAGSDGKPLGIGVVSVAARSFAKIGFLGVRTSDTEAGIVVEEAVVGSPAAKAGLVKGDIIRTINGEPSGMSFEFARKIGNIRTGEEVLLGLRNGDQEREARVTLGDRPGGATSKVGQKMDRMSGPMSARLGGFPMALQHDIPLSPSVCGGPLLDLDGNCVGINLSRSGRVSTLAAPADNLKALLAAARDSAPPENDPSADEGPRFGTPTEKAEIRKLIRDVRSQLKELEERLETLESR